MSAIEKVVMARVHRIHALRRFYAVTAFKVYGIVILFFVLTSLVSVASVYANMSSVSSPMQLCTFLFSAILNTESFVQCVLVAFVTMIGLLGRDILRSIKESEVYFARIRA